MKKKVNKSNFTQSVLEFELNLCYVSLSKTYAFTMYTW